MFINMLLCGKVLGHNLKKDRVLYKSTSLRKAAIFHLRSSEEVELDPEPNEAGYQTHRVPSYDLDTPSDVLENQIGLSVR